MKGLQIVTMDKVTSDIVIFAAAIGNLCIIAIEHMQKMKDIAIVENIGDFDNVIVVVVPCRHAWWASSLSQLMKPSVQCHLRFCHRQLQHHRP